MPKVAFVAALEREVAPLLRTWQYRTLEREGYRYRLFENGEVALICGGIGPEAARRATEAVIQETYPSRIVSVGFAGALDPKLKVGAIIEPRTVINANDGSRTQTGSGEYTLVSYPAVAGKEQKSRLREAFRAELVDMEAAAVAQGAEARGLEFAVLKVVSDDAEFAMPDVTRFITPDGRLREGAFALHVAFRPWLWPTMMTLARNSSKASNALSDAIVRYLQREKLACEELKQQ